MIVFVDTSAFYAVLDRDDSNHPKAKKAWSELLREGAALLPTTMSCSRRRPCCNTGSA